MKINNKNFLIIFLAIHFSIAIGISAIFLYLDKEDIIIFNFSIGHLLGALIVSSLVLVLKGILYKKSVALPVGVIVFKYAFIGILIHMLSSVGLVNNLYLVAGVSVLVPSSLAFGLIYTRTEQQVS